VGWLGFIAAIFKVLAWPVTLVIALVVFRRPISALIGSLQSVEYKKAVFKFARDLDRAEENAPPAPMEAAALPAKNAFTLDAAAPTFPPEERIKRAWYEVRRIVWDVAQKSGMRSGSHLKPLGTIAWLESQRIIDGPTARILRDLKRLRDTASLYRGSLDIDSEQAERFEELATRAMEVLEEAVKVSPKPVN